jgi:hypothetical protein
MQALCVVYWRLALQQLSRALQRCAQRRMQQAGVVRTSEQAASASQLQQLL